MPRHEKAFGLLLAKVGPRTVAQEASGTVHLRSHRELQWSFDSQPAGMCQPAACSLRTFDV